MAEDLASLPDRLRSLIGCVLAERYAIDALVGVGGMAAVFRGRHVALGRTVAVKVLRPEYGDHPEVASRFEREARAASVFDHPNCVSVFDCGRTSQGLRYMVMPLLDGEELAALITAPLPASQVLQVGIQIMRGLDHAHRHGVVHRDLKPDNVYVVASPDGGELLKIVDFGIAKVLENGSEGVLTRAGAIVGTPAYMSPEQALGNKVDGRADLYGAGVILYECAAGRRPFVAADARGLLYQHVYETPPALPGDTPPGLEAVVLRLMEKRPEHRFVSAAEAVAALMGAARGLGRAPWVSLLARAQPRETVVRSAPPAAGRMRSPTSSHALSAFDVAMRKILATRTPVAELALNSEIRPEDEADVEIDLDDI